MRNWDEIIKIAAEKNYITEDEKEVLLRKYEMTKEGGIKKILQGIGGTIKKPLSKMWDFASDKDNMGAIFAGSMVIPVASEIVSTAMKPIKTELAYQAMKQHLAKISPQDIKDYDDKQMRTVFGMVRTVAPIITSNAALAAVAVRDALDVPQTFNAGVLGNLARIQKDSVQGQLGQKARAVSDNLGGVADKSLQIANRLGKLHNTMSGN